MEVGSQLAMNYVNKKIKLCFFGGGRNVNYISNISFFAKITCNKPITFNRFNAKPSVFQESFHNPIQR